VCNVRSNSQWMFDSMVAHCHGDICNTACQTGKKA
jgi:hypothetical protein